MKDLWDISKLRNYDKNPRSIKGTDFARLKKHIERYGQMQPLVITPDGEVLGGNMRLRAYKELGIKDIWVEKVNPKDENDKLKISLILNDRAGFYDADLLANLMPEYDINWADYAVDLKEPITLDSLLEQEVIEDEVPEVSEGEAESKLGEVYELGRHRLMCGDSTRIEDVEKLMDGQKADMVLTDPPYGIDLDTDYSGMPSRWNNKEMYQGKYKKVEGDNKKFDASYLIPMAKEVFLFGADYYANTLPDSGINGTWYCWDKREDDDGDSFDKMLGSPFELCWSKNKRGKKFIRMRWASFLHSDATEGEQSKGRVHPTQKPIALMSWFIKHFSKENEAIQDLFGGSGSTLMACEQTNRTCFMMELDPKYVDVIRKRYDNYIQNNK